MSEFAPDRLPPRRRTPFRSGFDGPPPRNAASGVRYATVTEKPGTDRDILFGYQIFLGRDPENSFVIADGKSNSLRGFLHGLITSAECHGAVFTPLLNARALPHDRLAPGPAAEQIAWLLHVYEGDAAFAEAVRAAATWRDLWRALAAIPDFPGSQAASVAAAPAHAALVAADAAQGFVLIHADQPKAGERLAPGAILTGSGWCIAPTDIVHVGIQLNEQLLCHARHGLPRPDVARNFPHYRHVESCGFAFTTTLPADLPVSPTSLLRISVRTEDGETASKTIAVSVQGRGAAADEKNWPIRVVLESAQVDRAGDVRLRGYVLSRETLGELVVYIGDRALGVADRGMARPDVAAAFPDYPAALESGFVFAASLADEPPGHASIRVQATDAAGRRRQAIMPIEIPAIRPGRRRKAGHASAAAAHMRLEVDKPVLDGDVALAPARGALTISGWAVAPEGVAGIAASCDGVPIGQAYLGMRREDIGRAFPGYEGALLSGFGLVLPPGRLAVGTRAIRLTATSRAGATLDREFSIQIDAPETSAAGFSLRHTMPRAEIAFGHALLAARACRPRFTVLIRPGDETARAATMASLERQAYASWRAALVPSASAPEDGLVLLLRAGDVLGADSLLELAIAHAREPDADFFYGDDLRAAPFFKPDFSPELLLGTNYVGRAWCATSALLARAGLNLQALRNCGDYDAVLRLTEAARCVRHLDRLLLSCDPDRREPADIELAALESAMQRRRLRGAVVPLGDGTWRVRRAIASPGRISIIMPSCGANGLVRAAIGSLRATTAGRDVEILVLDNVPARDKKMKAWLRANADVVVDMPGGFNWSRFNNVGAEAASGDTLFFLNDDIEARDTGWLDALLEHTQSAEVGVVGARLLYPDGKVQHAGQFLAETHARHAFRFADSADAGPFGLASLAREVMAVTGACMAMRRAVFDRLGGFEEAHSVVNNDLDFCLKARKAGLSVIYTPHATLLHHELASRAGLEDSYDTGRFEGAWRQRFLLGDPYHGPRLLADADHFAPEPEPVMHIHVGPAGPDPATITSILAVKLDHIGDFLTAIPALRALKMRFPDARLSLLAPPATAALAVREPCIDETIEFTFFHAVSGRGQLGVTDDILDSLRARLAPKRFDMAIDLRMQPETRKTLRYTGAPFLVGYDHEGRFPFLDVALEWEGDTALLRKRAHISERLLQLVAAAAEACRKLQAVPLAAEADPRTVPALAALPPGFLSRRLVCVHPGVGNPVRQWPAAHYAALIDLLTGEAGLNAVLIGGGEEAAVAEEVLRLVTAKDRVASLVGQVKLPALGGLMQACALFVGNNSGPKHLAAQLGVPTLGIHSAVVDAVEWGPLGPAGFALRRDVVCGPCYLEFAADCPRAMACLTGIKPRDAFAACLRLLALRPDTISGKSPPVRVQGSTRAVGRMKGGRGR
jgi:ADP-heptose:LPS heptosyltransferase/GT2 family glycosyltransferase